MREYVNATRAPWRANAVAIARPSPREPPVTRHLLSCKRLIGSPATAYHRRSVVECCIGWLKECRRIATRFEKLALNFLAMLKLAIIEQYLRYEF